MFGFGEFLCLGLKRSVASMLPWDIPWYDPTHAIFFAALYGALGVITAGVLAALVISVFRLKNGQEESHH
jgi:hypothetical protein